MTTTCTTGSLTSEAPDDEGRPRSAATGDGGAELLTERLPSDVRIVPLLICRRTLGSDRGLWSRQLQLAASRCT